MRAEPHHKQSQRLEALRDLDILDTPREPEFDEIVEFAAEICQVPICVINLVEERRQWFKAETGLGVRETPIDSSICSHVILEPGLTEIPDTLEDPRFRDNPLCIGEPHLRFYAGALLETDDGLPIGTLCVLDNEPRTLTDFQKRALDLLAKQVMARILLQREARRARDAAMEVDHRIKNSLGLISSLVGLQIRTAGNDEIRDALRIVHDRVHAIGSIHDQLHSTGSLTTINLRTFCDRLALSLQAHAPPGVGVRADMPSVAIPAREAMTVGVVLNELVTNALRHAFSSERPGEVTIAGIRSNGNLELVVSDTGKGLPADFDPAESKGLGMRLALNAARQNGGELRWSSDGSGSRFAFDIPIVPSA